MFVRKYYEERGPRGAGYPFRELGLIGMVTCYPTDGISPWLAVLLALVMTTQSSLT